MYANPFEILSDEFEKMEVNGKIDLGILSNLDNAIKACRENEDYWTSNTEDVKSSYSLYHANRNLRLITEKIQNRVLTATENRDNPKIADDSLNILPLMSDLFSIIVNMKGKIATPNIIRYVENQAHLLRDNSFNLNLLPTSQEEAIGINKNLLRSRLTRFSTSIQEELFEI